MTESLPAIVTIPEQLNAAVVRFWEEYQGKYIRNPQFNEDELHSLFNTKREIVGVRADTKGPKNRQELVMVVELDELELRADKDDPYIQLPDVYEGFPVWIGPYQY